MASTEWIEQRGLADVVKEITAHIIMNTSRIGTVLCLGLVLAFGCSSKDSTDKARRINDQRIDKQAIATSDDAKKEAKQVAADMVDLASTSLAELELSKIALQKATNPAVKAYASQTMTAHTLDDRTLRNLARQMNVTLPAELANKGRNHVSKLAKMSAGTDFDLEYLDYMADINDDAIDAADNLRDNPPSDAVEAFAKKRVNDDRKHKDQARQLKNVLN